MLMPLRREGELWVLSPFAVPVHGLRLIDRLNELLLGSQLALACRATGIRHPILWSYLPQALGLRNWVGASRAIYFRCDDYASFRGVDKASVERLEREAVAKADLCIASARDYLDGPLVDASAALWSPNAVDLAHYAERGSDPYERFRRPVLLMMGTLEYWLAKDLLAEVAARRPGWSIVLAGPRRTDLSELFAIPNVTYLGVLDYDELPRYVGWADVCMIPFRVAPVTQGANPGKLFQYLGAAKPVVATRFLDPEPYGKLVYLADEDPVDFIAALERALTEDSPERQSARRASMQGETWEARFDEILSTLERVA
jgi:hypothetical protein